ETSRSGASAPDLLELHDHRLGFLGELRGHVLEDRVRRLAVGRDPGVTWRPPGGRASRPRALLARSTSGPSTMVEQGRLRRTTSVLGPSRPDGATALPAAARPGAGRWVLAVTALGLGGAALTYRDRADGPLAPVLAALALPMLAGALVWWLSGRR